MMRLARAVCVPLLSTLPAARGSILVGVGGACTFGAGDILAQQIEHDMQRQVVAVPPGGAANSYYPAVRGFELDHRRVSVATLMGSVWAGAVLPFVYGFAEKRFPGQSPLNVVLKMGVSCSILSTAGNYVSMLARIVLNDCTAQDLSLRCRQGIKSANDKILDVVKDDLKVWPLYDLLCFSVIPPSLRPITTSVVSVCWHTYMSYASAKSA